MTLDQIFMRLTDKKALRSRLGVTSVTPAQLGTGPRRGRTADGRAIQGRVAGVSKARQAMLRAAAKKETARAAEDAAKKQARRDRRARKRNKS